MDEVSTPLMTVKKNFLMAGLFPGCGEGFHMCSFLPSGFHLLKSGVQRLMDNKEILFAEESGFLEYVFDGIHFRDQQSSMGQHILS